MNKVLEVILKLTDQFTAPLQKSETGFKGFGETIKKVGGYLAGFFTAAAIGAFFKSAAEEAMKAERSIIRLGTSVRNAGGDFTTLRPRLDAAVESVVRLSTATDDDLNEALGHLITVTGDVEGSMKNLNLVADLAAYKQISVQEAANLLGKAMAGNTRVFTEFGIVGGTVNQRMDALRTVVSGFAEQDARSLHGRLQVINREWGEFKEQVGWAIVGSNNLGGSVGGLTNRLITLNKWMQDNQGSLARMTDTLVGAAGAIAKLGFFIVEHTPNLYTLGKAWDWLRGRTEEAGVATTAAIVSTGAALTGQRVLTQQEMAAIAAVHENGAGEITATQRALLNGLMAHQTEHGLLSLRLNKEQAEALEAVQRDGAAKRRQVAAQSNREALKQEEDALKALEDLRRTAMTASMTELGEELLKLQDMLTKALKTGNEQQRDDAVAAHKDAVAKILAARAGLDEMVPRMQVITERLKDYTFDYGEATETVIQGSVERYDNLRMAVAGVAGDVENAADEILKFAREAGIANEEVTNLVGGVANLADGIKSIAGAADFGSLLSGIGTVFAGLQGILGGLFGDSPAEQARKALLKENSHRLKELKERIGDLMNMDTPGAKLAKFEGATAGLQGLTGGGNGNFDERLRFAEFAKMLFAQGLSVSDAEELARNMGVGLGTEDGRLSSGALQQFIDAINSSEFSQFDQSFGGQEDFIETLLGVAGNTNPQDRLNLIVDRLLGPQGAGGFFGPLMAGGQANTAEGRAAIRDAFLDALNQMNAGTFNTGLFGQLSGADFVGVIEMLSELFTEMDGGVGGMPVVPSPSGSTMPGLGGVEFTGASIDIAMDIVAPLARIDMGIAKMVTAFETGVVGGVTVNIGSLTAGTPASAAGEVVTALDEALRIERDLAALTRGE